MRQLVLFVILSLVFYAQADTPYLELKPNYRIDSNQINPNLENGKSLVVVHINNENFDINEKILYGYEKKGFEAFLNAEKCFQFTVDSGQHVFQFYPDDKVGYEEITTHGGIQIVSGMTTYLSLTFQMAEVEVHVKKPVIYLYPTTETDVTVFVQPKGEMSFTYPEYQGNWECTALPSGEIFIDENAYNYLFWEAEQTVDVNELMKTKSTLVSNQNLITFLEETLDQFGFTSKETMDFITFWAPQMLKHEATEIRFIINEECTLFADLEIEPTPDNLLRFYMIWSPSDSLISDEPAAFEFPSSNRVGFTVLEWGGMEIPSSNASLSTLNHNSCKK